MDYILPNLAAWCEAELAGYWVYKDHGKYGIGKDRAIISKAYMSKPEARALVIKLHKASK